MYTLLTKKELSKLKLVTCLKDEVLFKENDICNNVGLVVQGEIVIKSYSLSGKEMIYNIIHEGECFGNNLLFSNNNLYKGEVSALKESKVLLINKEQFLKILKENQNFLNKYLEYEANNARHLNSRIKILSLDSSLDRLMYYLKEHHNHIEYSSITDLSKELNITRENLSRLISKLKKNKVIIVDNKTIKLIKTPY